MTFGFSTVMALVVAFYWLAAASFVTTHRQTTP
jgi:hypothetical protein